MCSCNNYNTQEHIGKLFIGRSAPGIIEEDESPWPEEDEETEELLKQAFPGRDEVFYEYGKWGGGAFNSEVFEELPFERQKSIENF